ncbi:hypothetical protein MYU51_010599 [Penicillium brevicompactum]
MTIRRVPWEAMENDLRIMFRPNIGGLAEGWYNQLKPDVRKDWTRVREAGTLYKVALDVELADRKAKLDVHNLNDCGGIRRWTGTGRKDWRQGLGVDCRQTFSKSSTPVPEGGIPVDDGSILGSFRLEPVSALSLLLLDPDRYVAAASCAWAIAIPSTYVEYRYPGFETAAGIQRHYRT